MSSVHEMSLPDDDNALESMIYVKPIFCKYSTPMQSYDHFPSSSIVNIVYCCCWSAREKFSDTLHTKLQIIFTKFKIL